MSNRSDYGKSGVWTNLEDQIVKAAIQKYGTHQWSKVASLLQNKSARQCQIRWDEYLNPKLNFGEFSRQEDARLLELARRLPNQWRTIADAMGRTAQTCIDRYNQLLEGDSDFGVGSSLQIEHPNNAETQAAKPDGMQLEDEEREMLAEARARLVNTQGKKATRKVRERMLEESKRIAQLQKRRELKQAGEKAAIKIPRKKYETEIDYNEDIAYEHQPQFGIYDTSLEDERMARDIANFEKAVSLRGLKEDSKGNISKRKREPETSMKESGEIINDIKRPKLQLSAPGMKDNADETIRSNRRALLAGENLEENEKPKKTVVEPRRTLSELFSLLPTPKNDFEIILDNEEEEKDDQQHTQENLIQEEYRSLQDDEENQVVQQMSLEPLQIDCLRFKAPDFIQNPNNIFEQTFNELVAAFSIKEPFLQPFDSKSLMDQVEHNMKTVSVESGHFQCPQPTESELRGSINEQLYIIEDLRRSFDYLKPLVQFNDKLCQKLCSEQLPLLRELQQKYYINYKIYQHEMQAIDIRRKRFQADLNGTMSSSTIS